MGWKRESWRVFWKLNRLATNPWKYAKPRVTLELHYALENPLQSPRVEGYPRNNVEKPVKAVRTVLTHNDLIQILNTRLELCEMIASLESPDKVKHCIGKAPGIFIRHYFNFEPSKFLKNWLIWGLKILEHIWWFLYHMSRKFAYFVFSIGKIS